MLLQKLNDPSAITGPGVTEALEQASVARGVEVVDVKFVCEITTGQTVRIARLRLTWNQPEGRPATIVATVLSADEHARAGAFAFASYLSEWEFYDQVAHTVGVREPKCFAARFDAEAPDLVLLLEDLSESRRSEQLEGPTPDQVALAIEQAVSFHAPRFADPGLETLFGGASPTRRSRPGTRSSRSSIPRVCPSPSVRPWRRSTPSGFGGHAPSGLAAPGAGASGPTWRCGSRRGAHVRRRRVGAR